MKIGKLYMVLDSAKMAIRGLSMEIKQALVSGDTRYAAKNDDRTEAEWLIIRRDELVNRVYDLQEFLDSLSNKVKIPELRMSQRQASHTLDRLDTLIGYYRGLLNTPVTATPPISAESVSKGLGKLEAERMKVASSLEQTIWTKEIIVDGFDDLLSEFGGETDIWNLPLVSISGGETEEPISSEFIMGPVVETVSQEVRVASPEDIAEVQAKLEALPNDPFVQSWSSTSNANFQLTDEDRDLSWLSGEKQPPLPVQAQDFDPKHQGSLQQRIASHQVNQAESPNLVMDPALIAKIQAEPTFPINQIVHPRCQLCNTPNRAAIEAFYSNSEADMLSTLDFISSIEPGRVMSTVARVHFDDHVAKH